MQGTFNPIRQVAKLQINQLVRNSEFLYSPYNASLPNSNENCQNLIIVQLVKKLSEFIVKKLEGALRHVQEPVTRRYPVPD